MSFIFLDVLVFIFLLQYLFCFFEGFLGSFIMGFVSFLMVVFSYSVSLPMSYMISLFTFLVLLVFCFGGYFSYSFCVCGMLEFTLIFSLVAWFATFLVMICSLKVSVYFSKFGDFFLKTFSMLLVELVSELSRPLALTIRLTVNVMVGHLIVGSLYMLIDYMGEFFVSFLIFAILMECFVFFIQSYIFSRLVYLYLNE
uniref:ATP synthase F0 subunit 6 n=1 Tax=Parafilaroides normani TaxID=1519083 RepID=A0A075QX97_PARNR|nr:ATP synthase F0 subunit 6 [Parafilaroides normani]AIG23804.1 ATP synthase F0 subunit 6 [Parafilaroides normani]